MKRYSASTRGFTLIEVLVALALMAMIATILITSLQTGAHSWQRVTRAADHAQDIAQTQHVLRQYLSVLYPYERAATDTLRPAFLVSDGSTLEFSAAAPQSLADGIMRYEIRVSADSHALVIRSRRDRNGLPDASAPDWTSESLLPRVSGVDIQFWLKPETGPGRWLNRWADSHQLPQLIRIDVAFAPNDPRRWPTLFVEPRINAPATCAFDVVSLRCRGES